MPLTLSPLERPFFHELVGHFPLGGSGAPEGCLGRLSDRSTIRRNKIYMREAYLDGALSDAATRLARAFSPVGGMVLPNGRGLF